MALKCVPCLLVFFVFMGVFVIAFVDGFFGVFGRVSLCVGVSIWKEEWVVYFVGD